VSGFTLDPQLEKDTRGVAQMDGIDIRLMRDSRYWWLVLVPQIDGAVEWHDLPETAQATLFDMSMRCSKALSHLAEADKMNVASLGNMVRQLHVHIIARHQGDAAWPSPVWGVGAMVEYEEENAGQRILAIQSFLKK
jgi:diadenosine tetraphosphate (Ap4A) HIT family hydrolase